MRAPDYDSGDGRARLWLGDCREIIDGIEADCVVTDPPYGMDLDTDFSGFNGWSGKGHAYEPIAGDDKPFDPRPLLSIGRRHVFWGAQYFCHRLPESGGWLVFNKRGDGKESQICFGDCELAWCDAMQSVRMYSHMWHGVTRWSTEGRLHPSQKPVGLMEWCAGFVSESGDSVLDPYMGSGTTGVACIKTGRRFIGVELDERYFSIAVKRIERALQDDRSSLFPVAKDVETQVELFA